MLCSSLVIKTVDAGVLPGVSQDPARPLELRLQPYRKGLRTLQVWVAGRPARFLFDTGGGFTVISPELASRVACVPYGRMTGFRMSGERLDVPQCGPVAIRLDGLMIAAESGVLDLGRMLPKDWPRLDGSLSLHSFGGRAITLDLAANRLIVETPDSLRRRIESMSEMRMFPGIGAGGRAMDVFVEAKAEQGSLRLLLDSGNTVGFILAPHALQQLGVARQGRDGGPLELRIELDGLAPAATPVVVEDIIHDGVIGVDFMERLVLTIDLGTGRLWGRFHRLPRHVEDDGG